jgi:hypothetical protein
MRTKEVIFKPTVGLFIYNRSIPGKGLSVKLNMYKHEALVNSGTPPIGGGLFDLRKCLLDSVSSAGRVARTQPANAHSRCSTDRRASSPATRQVSRKGKA